MESVSEIKSEIRKLYEKPIPSEIVTVVASHHAPDPDRNSVLSTDDSDSSDSENSDGNSEQREVVPHKIPVTAPRTEFPVPVTITIPAPPIKISAVPQIKVPVTVPQVVRQIEINSDSKDQAPDSSSDDDIGRYMIRRRDGEMEMPESDSSEDIGNYELKRRETQIKTQIKTHHFNSDSDSSVEVKRYEFKRREVHSKTQVFHSDSDSSVDVARYEFKRTEAHIKTADSHSDSLEDSGSEDVERYMILRRQPEVELSAQDSEGMSYDSEDIEIPTTPLRRRFRRRGISLRWRRNSLLILSLSLRRRLQFLVAKRRYILNISKFAI